MPQVYFLMTEYLLPFLVASFTKHLSVDQIKTSYQASNYNFLVLGRTLS
jgi:hypothetical protein